MIDCDSLQKERLLYILIALYLSLYSKPYILHSNIVCVAQCLLCRAVDSCLELLILVLFAMNLTALLLEFTMDKCHFMNSFSLKHQLICISLS